MHDKKSNTLILVGLNGLKRVSAMKFRPYLTRLMARLPLLSVLMVLTLRLAAMPTR